MNYELIVRMSLTEVMIVVVMLILLFIQSIFWIREYRNLKTDLIAEKMKSESNREEARGWWKMYCEAKGIGGKL